MIPVSWQSARRWLSYKPGGKVPLLPDSYTFGLPTRRASPVNAENVRHKNKNVKTRLLMKKYN